MKISDIIRYLYDVKDREGDLEVYTSFEGMVEMLDDTNIKVESIDDGYTYVPKCLIIEGG